MLFCDFNDALSQFLLPFPIFQGLFRKVLFGEIKASRLVRLSSENLGSRELAFWKDPNAKVGLSLLKFSHKQLLLTYLRKSVLPDKIFVLYMVNKSFLEILFGVL